MLLGILGVPSALQLARTLLQMLGPPAWNLAGRTALLLIVGLVVVQVAGLTIHALDRVDLQRFQQARELSQRSFVIWRSLLVTAPDRRAAVLADLDLPSGLRDTYDDAPAARHGHPPPPALVRMMRVEAVMSAPPRLRPREVIVSGANRPGVMLVSFRFPESGWLNLRVEMLPPRPWHSETFLFAFALTLLAGLATTLLAVAWFEGVRRVQAIRVPSPTCGRGPG
jgi:hypothetical protein